MGSKSPLRPKHYAKSCYFIRQIKEQGISEYSPEDDQIYSFAVEYKDHKHFFESYLNCDSDYQIKPSFHELASCRIPYTPFEYGIKWIDDDRDEFSTLKPITTKVCLFEKCDGIVTCEYKDYICKARNYDIHIAEQQNGRPMICNKCGNEVFSHTQRKISIRDVRLLGHPTSLDVTRVRGICTNCNILQGDNQMPCIQAFCDSVMTPRLAIATLRAYLSGIKRSYITEAYGISASQVDRIKKRMIELTRSRNAFSAYTIISALDIRITPISFYDSHNNEYFSYFVKNNNGEEILTNILTKQCHDCVDSYYHGKRADPVSVFQDKSEWINASIAVLNGEWKLSGEELDKRIKESCNKLYSSARENEAEKMFFSFNHILEQEQLERIWKSKNSGTNSNYDIDTETAQLQLEKDQYVLAEFYNDSNHKMESETVSPVISSFLSRLILLLNNKKHRSHPQVLMDHLLYFNPAAVSVVEMYWFAGEKFAGMDLHRSNNQYERQMLVRWGVPVRCLSYLIDEGLLKQNQKSLLHCFTITCDKYETYGFPEDDLPLPCKQKACYCIHCHELL